MGNLFSLNKKRDAVARSFRVSHTRATAFEPVSAIFPGHMAPIIKQSEDGERELVVRSWGFVPAARRLRAQARHQHAR